MVKRLFLTPPATPDETIARCLVIPASQQWLGVINAALLLLSQEWNWEQVHETDLTPAEAASRAMRIYEEYLLGAGACSVFDIRVLGGMLQKTYDGMAWLDVSPISVGNPIESVVTLTLAAGEEATATLVNGVLTLGIPVGAQGTQGIQGVQGEAGTNGTSGAAGADAGNVPVGTIIYWAGNGDLTGWLRANGQNVEIDDYPELYAVCGTTYGVGTETQFRVPNIVSKYIRGIDSGGGRGGTGGASTVTLTAAQLPAVNLNHSHAIQPHQHTIAKRNNSAFGNNNTLAATSASGTADTMNTGAGGTSDTDSATLGFGSGEAHENEPPYIKLQAMIKALPDAQPMNVEFQVDGCELQWRKDGGEWSTLVDLSECTEAGAQGVQGIQGVQGERGASGDCECSDSPTPIDSDWETWCGIANTITQYMNIYLEDVLDRIDANTSIAQAASSLFSTIPVIGWETDAVVETITDATNVTTNGVRADITQETIEEARNALYDAIQANGGYSFDVLGQWRDDQSAYWVSQINAGMVVYMSVINDLSEADWARQAYLGSLSPSTECSEDIPCTSQETEIWYPPEQELTDPDAEGEISPTPPTAGEFGGEYYYPYETGDTLTFTLDTPLAADQVQIAVYLSEPVSFAPKPTVYVNGEEVFSNFCQGATGGSPTGMDSQNCHYDFPPTLVETVQITFPAGRADWWLRHITFQECLS